MTIKPVIQRDQAVRDVEHAIDYYLDEGAAQAASDLIDALQAAYRLIGQHPGIGSPRYGYELDIPGLRGRALGHFSYPVLYLERADHIDVLRVLHQRRDLPELLRNLDQD
ncbi:type II toxin-antitoxin system RelE/ParE family toxin [Mycobacterium riyadhense]|uniref:Plasmid stabilization protein n=1 Tax=Mycobacterium riyadhense TaxID=486698 RepID=A0A1X2D6D8_9MYCO|nr:type II toxin-antitoxin system RelE/ParE family toxin [Mycobacterium riyadhense]MCV7148147.1 type II toxin-antitoxin system RelE/ParE family toxin [Mycobacterium riyadhense]ORW83718.1 plasmid stabilization protein [Mycobacterium riyadhense]